MIDGAILWSETFSSATIMERRKKVGVEILYASMDFEYRETNKQIDKLSLSLDIGFKFGFGFGFDLTTWIDFVKSRVIDWGC